MRSRAPVWPVLLIGVGLVALLANLGFLPAFSIGRAIAIGWPLILVLIGIDLAVSRRSPMVGLALQLAAVALVATAIVVRADIVPPAGESRVSVARGGATAYGFRASVGGAHFVLRGGATGLLEGSSTKSDLRVRSSGTAASPDIRLDQGDGQFFGDGTADIDARIASDLPATVRVDGGAGEFILDLRDVQATDVRISTGASSVLLTLPKPAGEVPVRIDSGASSIVIEIPEGVEAKVTTSGGLVSTSGRTETPGYAAARARVTVSISAGASSVTIR